jgi:uncharacterized protein (DUF305 family)
MTKLPTLLATGALLLAGGVAWAQDDAEGHEGHMTEGEAGMESEHAMPMSEDPALEPFMAPMHQMMVDMPMTSSGDVDADFLLMMIPHHQSAIDMARVVLDQGGDDEETRALAEEIIAAQEAEIAEMRAMLERMGVEPPAAE